MRDTLNNLREKPKEEKRTIAASLALGVVAILFVGWLIYFFHAIMTQPAPDFQSVAAEAASSTNLGQVQEQIQQAYGSSTQFIDMQQSVQLEEVNSTSSAPSL